MSVYCLHLVADIQPGHCHKHERVTPIHGASGYRFLHKVLQKNEGYIGTLLHIAVHDRLASVNDTEVTGKQRQSLISSNQTLENLVHHLAAAVPALLARVMPKGAEKLGKATEKDALMALELLRLQVSAPSAEDEQRSKYLQQLLDAQANQSERVRLKLTNVVPAMLAVSLASHDLRDIEKTLVVLSLDSDPAIRAAAVRALGAVAAAWGDRVRDGDRPVAEQLELLSRMVDRLRDSVPEVREAVCCCPT